MSDVVNRTTVQYLKSVHTPNFPDADWIINPDLSALASVPQKYWKISGDTVLEMNTTEKETVDDTALAASVSAKETDLKGRFVHPDLISELGLTAVPTGLVIDMESTKLDITDSVTVVADPDDTKEVRCRLKYDDASDTFSFQVDEKTTSEFAELEDDETLISEVKIFSLVAAGTSLTEL